MKKRHVWVGAFALLLVVAWCVTLLGDDETLSGGPAGQPDAPATAQGDCPATDAVYDDDDGTCHPGEIVSVQRVVDGDTLKLADGRRVRVLGIDAPEADTCAGPGATEHTRSLVAGRQVKLVKEPGVDTDRYDRLLRYVQVSGPAERATGGPGRWRDLGHDLARNGWARPYLGDANPRYLQRITSAVTNAEREPAGMHAPPCG